MSNKYQLLINISIYCTSASIESVRFELFSYYMVAQGLNSTCISSRKRNEFYLMLAPLLPARLIFKNKPEKRYEKGFIISSATSQ